MRVIDATMATKALPRKKTPSVIMKNKKSSEPHIGPQSLHITCKEAAGDS